MSSSIFVVRHMKVCYECVCMVCPSDFMWLRVTSSLKIEGKHVRKGNRWAPRELSGELYDKILGLFAAVIKSY